MNTTELMALSNGQRNCTIIQDTDEHESTGWKLIHIIEEATVTVLVNTLADSGSTYVGLTLPVGAVLGGNFTNIKLASGAVIAYS